MSDPTEARLAEADLAEKHYKCESGTDPAHLLVYCAECKEHWPCPTRIIISEVERLKAELAEAKKENERLAFIVNDRQERGNEWYESFHRMMAERDAANERAEKLARQARTLVVNDGRGYDAYWITDAADLLAKVGLIGPKGASDAAQDEEPDHCHVCGDLDHTELSCQSESAHRKDEGEKR